jgi:RNA polymerase sigma-70 factor (family 1)
MLIEEQTEDRFEKKVFEIAKDSQETQVISDEYFIQSSFASSPQKGFELLFRKYYTNLCNHAIRFVYSKEIAEDIVAEVFTNFWQNKVYENISSSYRSYLYKSVRNRAYNAIKLEINRTTNLENSQAEYQFSDNSPVLQPDEILHYHELSLKLDLAIQLLPQQSRKAFQLNRLEGKKYAEVALEMQITVSAVERLISRALAKIRGELKSEWIFSILLLLNLSYHN